MIVKLPPGDDPSHYTRTVRLRVASALGVGSGLLVCAQVLAQSDGSGARPATSSTVAPAPALVSGAPPIPKAELPGSQLCTARLIVRLNVATEVSGCPTDVEVAAWVDELAAEHIATSASQHDAEAASCTAETNPRHTAQEVLVRVELARAELTVSPNNAAPNHLETEPRSVRLPELAAFVVLPLVGARPTNVAPDPTTQPMRTLVQRVTCEELLRVAALSISLLVNPEPSSNAQPRTTATLGNSATPDGGATLNNGAEPRTDTFATSDVGPSPEAIAALAPARAAALPHDVSPATPAHAASDTTAGAAPLGFVLGGRASVGGGLNPGFNLGVDGFAGIGITPWWLEVYASYASSAKGSIVRDAGLAGSVRSRTLELGLLPCRRWATGYRICAEAGYVMFAAEGRGFDSDRDDNLNLWGVGGQGSYSWPLLGALWANLGLAVLVPLSRVDMRVSGVSEPVWQMPAVTARGALGLEWR